MTLRLRLAFLFAGVLVVLSGLFLLSAQGHLVRHFRAIALDPSQNGRLSEEQVGHMIEEVRGLWLVAGVPVMGLSFLLGFLLATRSVSHLHQLNTSLARVRPGDLGIELEVPDRDPELRHLVGNINGLLSRIGRSYAELSEFAASVAHELRTPLTLLRLRVEEAAASLPPDFSEDLQEEIQRMSRLVERTLVMSRAEGGLLALERTKVDLSAILGRLHEDYAALAQTKDMDLVWAAEPDLSVTGDTDTTRQILHNLLDNALRYGGRKVTLKAARTGKSMVSIEITNDLPAEPHTVRGTGLGLRLVTSLTRAMPGWEFESGQTGDTYRATLVAPAA